MPSFENLAERSESRFEFSNDQTYLEISLISPEEHEEKQLLGLQ